MSVPHLLSIYLADHHAGAVAGTALARRMADSNRGTSYGEELELLATEIDEDRGELESLMQGLGVGQDRLKDIAAGVGERLGRLKRNGRWTSYSPLSRLLELEGLAAGVEAKLSLWRSLRDARGDDVAGVDILALEGRAERQQERLDQLRRRAAAEALRTD